jgi:hypothetical protein
MKKKIKSSRSTVDSITANGTLGIVRTAIIQRLKDTGRTRNWLAVATGLRAATVYDFLAGHQDVHAAKAEKMLVALGLKISSAPDTTPDAKGRSTNRAKLR